MAAASEVRGIDTGVLEFIKDLSSLQQGSVTLGWFAGTYLGKEGEAPRDFFETRAKVVRTASDILTKISEGKNVGIENRVLALRARQCVVAADEKRPFSLTSPFAIAANIRGFFASKDLPEVSSSDLILRLTEEERKEVEDLLGDDLDGKTIEQALVLATITKVRRGLIDRFGAGEDSPVVRVMQELKGLLGVKEE